MTTIKTQNSIPKILLCSNLFFLIVWGSAKIINDVYKYPVLGALYEMLWLPALFLLFASALVSLVFWAKYKFVLNTVYFYLFGFSVILLCFLFGLNYS